MRSCGGTEGYCSKKETADEENAPTGSEMEGSRGVIL